MPSQDVALSPEKQRVVSESQRKHARQRAQQQRKRVQIVDGRPVFIVTGTDEDEDEANGQNDDGDGGCPSNQALLLCVGVLTMPPRTTEIFPGTWSESADSALSTCCAAIDATPASLGVDEIAERLDLWVNGDDDVVVEDPPPRTGSVGEHPGDASLEASGTSSR